MVPGAQPISVSAYTAGDDRMEWLEIAYYGAIAIAGLSLSAAVWFLAIDRL